MKAHKYWSLGAFITMIGTVYTGYKGDKNTPDFKAMEVYLKRVWFSNGIYHHYGCEKFEPEFTEAYFRNVVLATANDLSLIHI